MLRRDRHGKTEDILAWRSLDLDDVELRHGTAVTEPYPRHWHEEYSLCLHTAGGGALEYRGRDHAAPRGSLFIVHPGEVHANHTDDEGCSFRSLYVTPARVRRVVTQLGGEVGPLPFFPRPMLFDREVVAAFVALHRTLEHGGRRLAAEEQLTGLIAMLVERHAETPRDPRTVGRERDAVRRVREHLDVAYADNVALDDLARLAGISPYHLTRVFRAEIGMPPHAYQTARRILRAKALIRDGVPLAAVAAATGFVDQSHFSRHFKWLVKLTPGAYSQSSKKVQDWRVAAG